MAKATLTISSKNYSSWSLRGWLMAKIAGIEFDEIMVPLDRPETLATIRKSLQSGRGALLTGGELRVMEQQLEVFGGPGEHRSGRGQRAPARCRRGAHCGR